MSPTPASDELARVRATYPPLGFRGMVLLAALFVVVTIVNHFRVHWWFAAFLIAETAGWELTKFRLRRNAEKFAQASAAS